MLCWFKQIDQSAG